MTAVIEVYAEEWVRLGPQTPAQVLLKEYADTVSRGGWNTGSGLRFYSSSLAYHNTNGTIYHGGEQMWSWMKELFAPFEKLRHPMHYVREIPREDGTVTLDFRCTRQIWMKGNTEEKPDVEVPMFWTCTIGPGAEGFNGLQFREVHLFWDTAPLMRLMKGDAVVFRTENPYDKEQK